MRKKYSNFIKKIIILCLIACCLINLNVSNALAFESKEIITDLNSYLTQEEINTIVQSNFTTDSPTTYGNVIWTPALTTTLYADGSSYMGKYTLTAKNVSIQNSTIRNVYLVANLRIVTNTGETVMKAMQRPAGSLSPGEEVSEVFAGWAVYNEIKQIDFFAYGTVNGVQYYSTPIPVYF